MSSSSSPLLSILVPTYAYTNGVERILHALLPLPHNIEVLIFDDTPGAEVQKVVQRYTRQYSGVKYRHNTQYFGAPLGAGANWNSLLNSATGQYVILMHHDEVPLGDGFVDALLDRLDNETAQDVIVLDLMLVDEALLAPRRHVPSWLRSLVLRRTPNYLFRRNLIGPSACLVIRRSISPRFDPNLQWLIDVDFYVRLFRAPLKWDVAPEICIGSIRRNEGTITATISGRLAAIDADERKALAVRHPQARIWLGARWGEPIRWIESVAWIGLRAVSLVIARLAKR